MSSPPPSPLREIDTAAQSNSVSGETQAAPVRSTSSYERQRHRLSNNQPSETTSKAATATSRLTNSTPPKGLSRKRKELHASAGSISASRSDSEPQSGSNRRKRRKPNEIPSPASQPDPSSNTFDVTLALVGTPTSLSQQAQAPTQPAVNTNSTFQQGKAPEASRGIVASGPAAVVHPTHPPQPVLPDDADCPVDWTLEALNDLPERSIESYMLRTPWRAVSAYSTEQVKDILNAKYGTKFSSEAWRKRSKTVNVRVYLATGMWWDNFTTGLEDFFHVRQPRRPKNGNEKVITTGDEEDGDDDGGFTSRGIKDKNIFTILGNDEEGINFRCYATLEAASAASPLFDAAIAKDIFVYPRRFDTTRRALDMFLSCFMPIQQGNLPTSGCKLVRGTKDDSLRMLSLDWTLSDLFNVFALSDELENHKISNMVFNAWRKVLWNEEFLRWQYQEGKRKLSDPAINSSPSILDFKPAELNRLFSDDSASEVRAAAQDFWLGLLVIARDRGIQKIQDSQDEYSQEFLVKWHQYLSEAQQEAQKQDEQGNINMVDSGSSFAKHLDVLLNGNDADFCREYHIHAQNEVCDTPVSTAATIVKDSPRTEQPPSPRQAKLTIHSIPGFTIQNRTPLDEPTFKNVFAEAGWDEPERIRSVNDYVLNRRDFKDFRDYRPVEQPVYFSTGLQDPQGRWPSHPGYMNPDWKLDTVEDAQSQDPQSKEQAPEVQVIDFGTAPRVSNNLEGNTTNSQKLTEFKMNLTPEQLQDLSNSLPISDRVMALQEREAWWRAIMSSTYLR